MAVDRGVSIEITRRSRAQNGAITGEQLHRAGLTHSAIRARVARGRLVRLFRGVYAVGDPELLPLVWPTAALLSIGPRALLSHRSAAAVWQLAESDPQTIDVTVVDANPHPRAGVRLHRVKQLHHSDATTRFNLRVTSPARTMIDFAAQAGSSELADAFGDARARRLVADRALLPALSRMPDNHRGAPVVRAMLREGGSYDRSRAEQLMRRHLKAAGLPQPLVNVNLHGYVEVDGYLTHGTRAAFEADRRRDRVHVAAGYVVIRVTWPALRQEPLAVITAIAQAMARRVA